MSKKGIYAIDPRTLERVDYADAEALAKEICDWVKKSGTPATLHKHDTITSYHATFTLSDEDNYCSQQGAHDSPCWG